MMINFECLHQAIVDAKNGKDWRVGLLSRQTIAEKFPFKNEDSGVGKTKVGSTSTEKKVMDATTPWATLLHLAVREVSAQGSTQPRQSYGSKARLAFEHPLLKTAYRKAVNSLTASTGFSQTDVDRTLAQRWSDGRIWSRSVEACIRWMRDIPGTWFSECEDCGEENEVPWDKCEHCGASRDT